MRNRTAFTSLLMCWAVAGCDDPRANCARVQEPERAIRACTALINSGRETKHTVAIALYNRGIAKNNKGKYEDAILDFTQAAKLYRDDAKIYFQRALASFSVGREAIADYTEALRLNPRYQLAFSRRAAAEVAKEHYPAAISDATEAVKINPEDDFAYATRAAARYFMRDYSGSVSDFTEALRITPRDATRYVARAWAYVGLLQTGAALSDADLAIKLAPDNASAHELRAYINRQLGRTEQAIADLRAALRADPSREAIKEALLKLGVAP